MKSRLRISDPHYLCMLTFHLRLLNTFQSTQEEVRTRFPRGSLKRHLK